MLWLLIHHLCKTKNLINNAWPSNDSMLSQFNNRLRTTKRSIHNPIFHKCIIYIVCPLLVNFVTTAFSFYNKEKHLFLIHFVQTTFLHPHLFLCFSLKFVMNCWRTRKLIKNRFHYPLQLYYYKRVCFTEQWCVNLAIAHLLCFYSF